MRKILAVLLALIMTAASVTAIFGAEMKFTDVKQSDWFYNDVKTAVESGLVNGKSDTTYCPNDNLTYAEAIKLAACMNQLYTEGKVTLTGGSPWYMPYVEYCKANGIISKDYNYTEKATRAGYMEIFASALPDEGLKSINNVPDNSIPDVPSDKSYAAPVYKLYRAGILTGVDQEHNCKPFANIKRSEVAAILTRMMNEDQRVSFSMGEQEPVQDPVKPLSAAIVPENAVIKDNETVQILVTAKDGTAPYSYDWQVRMITGAAGKKGSSYEYVSVNDDRAADLAAAASGERLTFKATKELLDKYDRVICKVTDKDGNVVTTEPCTLSYGGSYKYNDFAGDDFFMYIEDLYWIENRGSVVTGRIVNGNIKVGDAVKIYAEDGETITATVEGIEMFKKSLNEAKKGDNVGIQLGSINRETHNTLKKGFSLGGYNDTYIVSDWILGIFTPADGAFNVTYDSQQVSVYFGNAADASANIYIYNKDERNGVTTSALDFDYKNYRVWYPGQTLKIRQNGKEVGTFRVTVVKYPHWLYESDR